MAATTTTGESFLIDCLDTKDKSPFAKYLDAIAKEGIKKRWRTFSLKFVALLPTIINLKKLGANLQQDQNDFKNVPSADLIDVIAQFRSKSPPFLKPHFEAGNCMTPCDCWQLVKISEALKKQIIALHSCGSTTAPLEKMFFFSFGWIQ